MAGQGVMPVQRMIPLPLADFSEPDPVVEEPEVELFTREELEVEVSSAQAAALEKGLAEGYTKGHAAAMEELAADQSRALQQISESLGAAAEEQSQLAATVEQELRAVLEQLVGCLCARLQE